MKSNRRTAGRIEYLKAWYAKHPNYNHEYYMAHKEKSKARAKEWQAAHIETVRKSKREYAARAYAADPKKHREAAKVQRVIHAEEISHRKRKSVSEASDGYVRDRLCDGTSLSRKDIPDVFVACKRVELLIKREIKKGIRR